MGGLQQQKDDLPDTQSQASQIWTNNIESQPVENIVWGRLYAKNIQMKSLDLCRESISAGRADNNDLCFTEEELPEKILCRISKIHFRIKRDLSEDLSPVFIQDFSRNGTFINGERIGDSKIRILQTDDVISLAHPENKVFVFKDLCQNNSKTLPPEVQAKYFVSRILGNGACGLVCLIYDRRTCEKYAMKHVKKNLLVESSKPNILNDPLRVINEANIIKSLKHPCVIRMHDIVDKPESVYMILEYMRGGDLLNRITSKKRLTEEISKFFFYQMCHAVKYLHDNGITHRDLKPDNILLETNDEETLLKVSDFGLSKFVHKNSVMRTLCGTPLYVAPEILVTNGKGSYTKKVDVWSLGVVLFTCLSGTLPFSDDYGSVATEQIKMGKFCFAHPSWKTVSPLAKSLIMKMLTVNPSYRPTVDYVLKHLWLQHDKQIIKKANKLMNITDSSLSSLLSLSRTTSTISQTITAKSIMNNNSDDENFLEPPIKKAKKQ